MNENMQISNAEMRVMEIIWECGEMMYEGVSQKVTVSENSRFDTKHLHKFVDITLKQHVKNSEGSCTTTYYKGKKCTVCEIVWKGDVIRTVTDTVCAH